MIVRDRWARRLHWRGLATSSLAKCYAAIPVAYEGAKKRQSLVSSPEGLHHNTVRLKPDTTYCPCVQITVRLKPDTTY